MSSSLISSKLKNTLVLVVEPSKGEKVRCPMSRETEDVIVEEFLRDRVGSTEVLNQVIGQVRPKHIVGFARNPVVQQVGGIFMLGLAVFGIASLFDD